jgi:hypothetical protein
MRGDSGTIRIPEISNQATLKCIHYWVCPSVRGAGSWARST